MVLNTKELKSACNKILTAIDNNSTMAVTGMLELITIDNVFYLNVTNKEYFVTVTLGNCEEDFHATIDAEVFLKLVSQSTSDDIELKVNENTLIVKANGTFKFPLIYDNKEILTLPKIDIINPTVNFAIDSNILNSILVNNTKELSKIPKSGKLAVNPVQKMYYLDEQGAVTFYNGACVNKFTLDKPVKLLLNLNLVKLFGLFKNTAVDFTLGYDALSNDIIQTKVRFKTDDVCITAILNCNDTLLAGVPVSAIRGRAFNEYPYVITLNRAEFLQTIQRLALFARTGDFGKFCGAFKFTKSSCIISDDIKENSEEIKYANELTADINYEALLDLNDVKLALESNTDQYVTISFGDHTAMVLAKDNIYTVIPELLK